MLKSLKKNGKKNLKKHYLLFVFICFLAAFIGSEFTNSSNATKGMDHMEVQNADGETILYNDTGEIIEMHVAETVENLKSRNGNKIFETNKGFLAMAINTLSSGSFYLRIAQGIMSMVHSEQIGNIILIILVLILLFFVYFYIQNAYKVVARRIFLEGRIYSKIPSQRFALIIRIKKWSKVAFTMFVLAVLKTLWMFTIIGGIIKKYSYYLVPYIVAENPDISALKAIKFSRNMMKGYKWKCFLYEMSFIGWDILSTVTAGLSAIFYSNPYKMTTFAEFYVMVREKAKENNIDLSENLNDKYLFEVATDEVLHEKYVDVLNDVYAQDEEKLVDKKDLRHLLNKYFGISLYSKDFSDAYEKQQIRKMKREKYQNILEKKTYPDRLFTINRKQKKKKLQIESLNYLRSYKITSLIVLFFVLCFIGWIYEVSIHLVRDGVFVNRGTMHGPWLPIYGWGGLLIITLLYNFRTNPKKQFFATIVLCGIVEYISSFALDVIYGQKWWDYSGYFVNLNGRICLEGLLIFGLGGLAISYIIAPMLDNALRKVSKKALVPMLVGLVTIFIIDQIYSWKVPNVGQGITSYSYVEKVESIANK